MAAFANIKGQMRSICNNAAIDELRHAGILNWEQKRKAQISNLNCDIEGIIQKWTLHRDQASWIATKGENQAMSKREQELFLAIVGQNVTLEEKDAEGKAYVMRLHNQDALCALAIIERSASNIFEQAQKE